MEKKLQTIAEILKIRFSANEFAEMESDMESIIELMDSLKNAQLDEEIIVQDALVISELRDDIPQKSIDPDLLTSQSAEGDGYSIPKILE